MLRCTTLSGLLIVTSLPAPAPPEPTQDKDLRVLQQFVAELIVVTPGIGRFAESAGQPEHHFRMGRFEVPQDLYEAIMGHNPSRWKGPRNSAESMTFTEAVTFCERLTVRLRHCGLLRADELVRLPGEAEWEYCCRAGTRTDYSFGNSATASGDAGASARLLDPYAWHHGNAAGNDPAVGALKANAWGFHDMHGYLWELCRDPWLPPPPSGARLCVMRGGSWRDHYSLLKSSSRWPVPDHARSDAVGFRCVVAGVED